MLSAEEILSSTKQVIAGLEALRGENRTLLDNLQETLLSRTTSESNSLEEEKSGIILQSLDRIELGLGEAQVGFRNRHLLCVVYTSLYSYTKALSGIRHNIHGKKVNMHTYFF